jgi:hypothetical protein
VPPWFRPLDLTLDAPHLLHVTSFSLEKHEAWAAEIKAHISRYAQLRKQVRYFPLLAFVTAPVGLFWAPWVAIAVFLAWMSFWGTTLYITHMKAWQCRQELQQLRADVAAFRKA